MQTLGDTYVNDNLLTESDISDSSTLDDDNKLPTNSQVRSYALSYSEYQNLTQEQKNQALENLGLVDATTIDW